MASRPHPFTFQTLAQLPQALRAYWVEVGLASIMINFGQLLLPLFSMLVYDKVVSNGVFETLWALALGMGIFMAMDAGMRTVRAWAVEHVAADIARKVDSGLWHQLWREREGPAGGISVFLAQYRELTGALNFVSSTYLLALADLPFYALYLLVIGLIAWPLAILVALLTLTYALAGYLIQHRAQRLSKAAEHAATERFALVGEVLQGLDVLRTLPAAGRVEQAWISRADAAGEAESARRLAAQHASTLASTMSTLSVVSLLVCGTYLIEAGMLSVGGLIACSLLASRAMMTVASLYLVLGKWQDFKSALERMGALMNFDIVQTSSDRRPVISTEPLQKKSARGDIALRRVSKHYLGRPTVLEDISFNIAAGETVALLGRPGAGKSTLLKMLAGLSRADEGRILIDGYELEAISPEDRAYWIAYKPQEPVLFAGTLEENLLLAGSTPGDERFERALWASGLDEELKHGRLALSMAIANGGSNLSGGQRQKVALARAFAQPHSLLLLDEPSLGLDPEGEKRVAERLREVVGKGSLIMVTHSSAMLNAVERVIGLDAGRIVADGPRQQLVRAA